MGISLFLLSSFLYASIRLRGNFSAIFLRWLRFGATGTTFAYAVKFFTGNPAPFGLLVATGLTLWFLAEGMATWGQVRRLGDMEAPFCLRYDPADDLSLWPNAPDLRSVQNSKECGGFLLETMARVDHRGKLLFLCPILLSADRQIRLVMRFPLPLEGTAPASFIFYSVDGGGRTIVTENFCGVFAGYYPDSWDVRRRPLVASLFRLLALHRRRLCDRSPAAMDGNPIEMLNGLQDALLEENRGRNFLIAGAGAGRSSLRFGSEAGFRIWLEVFLLRYFGRPLG
ncbi:MAG: hypothetical protein LBS68_01150 [Puniceicoccales bacterium]|nr:hypothetical protein [Puniceicoccales bacterium]